MVLSRAWRCTFSRSRMVISTYFKGGKYLSLERRIVPAYHGRGCYLFIVVYTLRHRMCIHGLWFDVFG